MNTLIQSGILPAIGAYGRTATEEDWDSGKDFKVVSGPYFSKRDVEQLKAEGYTLIAFLSNMGGGLLFTREL